MALLKCFGAALILAALTRPAQAENWAVLIGIADYPATTAADQPKLEGPRHDVDALKAALGKWGFRDDGVHIISLKDRQASRAGIIDALLAVEKNARPGDQVFIYYSGHGTSPNDPRLGGALNLPYASGALVPYDFPKNGNAQAQRAALIIPREHLKTQVLEKLNRDRGVFVLFDTCYSEHTARSTAKNLPVRAMPLLDMPTGDDKFDYNAGTDSRKLPPYPYPDNIVFLGASGSAETAVDINQANLSRYQTIDGLPHGALTDAFLRVLAGKQAADSNHDGTIEYKELQTALHDRLKSQGIGQTPSLSPKIEEDRPPFLRSRAMFGQKAPFARLAATPASANAAPIVKVQFLASAADLAGDLRKLAAINAVGADGDLVVDRVGGAYRLLNKAQDVVAEVPVSDPKAILGRILQEGVLMHLEPTAAQNAAFNLELSLDNATKGITREENDTFALVANADEASYWLLLDIKTNGKVEAVYPREAHEQEIRPGKQVFFIPGSRETDKMIVTPPFGMDHVLAFAFKAKPAWLADISKEPLEPGSPEFDKLVGQLLAVKGAYAFGKLDILTLPKKNL